MKELSVLLQARRQKLEQLRELGVNPYANNFPVHHNTGEILKKYQEFSAEALESVEEEYSIAGRIMTIRSFGKAAFIVLQDRSGRLQIYIRKNTIGNDAFKVFKLFDIGDIVGVVGKPFRTRTGELSLHVSTIRLLTKNLRPLPEKWHGLTDTETRFRQRYVDLTVNPDVVDIFRRRSQIIRMMRDYLERHGFMEVETPMLHPLVGGAAAKPFTTRHNALNMDLYLRIAPELYLKRLLVGGLERVYEINRSFRNEGISIQHNPEFTMVEFYWAYATYENLMEMTEEMIGAIVKALHDTYRIPYQGQTLDFTPPWERLTVKDAVIKYSAFGERDLDSRDALLATAKRVGIEDAGNMGDGKLLMGIFEELAETQLVQPTFLLDFPLEVSPLARKKESDPSLVDRFELYIAGREIANAFSELNDPIDQLSRFEDQLRAREAGDEEAHMMDDDYIRALEYGMPPAAGEGIGIDRLAMLLTDSASIREVILFPQLRREQ